MVFCVFLETWKLQSSFIVTAWKRSISTTFQNFQERKLYRFGMTWVRVNNERTFSLGKIKWFERRINYLLPPLDWLTRKLKKKKYKGGDKEIKARKGRIEGKKIRDNTRMICSDSLFFGKVTLQREVEMPSGTSDRAGAQKLCWRLNLSRRSCQALYDHAAGVYCSMSHCLNKVTNKSPHWSPIVNRAG